MRWSIGYFGVKDLFTIINCLGGVLGIFFAARGRPDLATYAVFAGFFFGDAIDGTIARLTRTGNRFGAEFDSASDHLAQGIAPAVILWSAYDQLGHGRIGLALMAFLCITATIRMARFNVARFDFPTCYAGLPRTVSGYTAVSFVNASLFFRPAGFGFWVGIALVVVLGLMNLIPIPYMTHKGRKLPGWARVAAGVFFIVPAAVLIFAPSFLFDLLFTFFFGYATMGWMPVVPEERRAFYVEYRRWASEVATAK